MEQLSGISQTPAKKAKGSSGEASAGMVGEGGDDRFAAVDFSTPGDGASDAGNVCGARRSRCQRWTFGQDATALGKVEIVKDEINFFFEGEKVLSSSRTKYREMWSQTTHKMQALRSYFHAGPALEWVQRVHAPTDF